MITDHQPASARLYPLRHRPFTWRRFRFHMILLCIIAWLAFGAWG